MLDDWSVYVHRMASWAVVHMYNNMLGHRGPRPSPRLHGARAGPDCRAIKFLRIAFMRQVIEFRDVFTPLSLKAGLAHDSGAIKPFEGRSCSG